MYEVQLIATDDADWNEAVEIIDDNTNLPFNAAADATFDFQVTQHGRAVLTASTSDATLTRPAQNQIAWLFTQAQLGGLCRGTTYKFGMRMTTADGSLLVMTGTLAFIDGGMAS